MYNTFLKSLFLRLVPGVATIRKDQQAGQFVVAFPMGRSGDPRGTPGPGLRRFIAGSWCKKGVGKARVAAARKLGVRLWIMLRDEIDYPEFCRRGHQLRRCSGAACAGMLIGDSGLN
jgi:hypothetical protein